jgi:hypothetical protein
MTFSVPSGAPYEPRHLTRDGTDLDPEAAGFASNACAVSGGDVT